MGDPFSYQSDEAHIATAGASQDALDFEFTGER
jgi:hypothetical protein